MIQCVNEAYYALDGGKTFVPAKDHPEWDPEDGRKNTIAYQIIADHNTSGDPANLQLKFDAIGVYDNTYVCTNMRKPSARNTGASSYRPMKR